MKIATIGDLHLEHAALRHDDDNWLGEVLLLSGDIGSPHALHKNKKFFKTLAKRFDRVLAVKGNHECYGYDIREIDTILTDFYSSVGIVYMDRSTHPLTKDLFVIGCTLWTDFNKNNPIAMTAAAAGMADYRYIRKGSRILTPMDVYNIHTDDMTYIKNVLHKNDDKKAIILTHHSPTYRIGKAIQARSRYPQMVHSFSSDKEQFIEENTNITHWCSGHIHSNEVHQIGETTVISHSRGYPEELFKFNSIDRMLKWL